MARATGSYPVGHGFKSNLRYHWPVGQAAKTPPFHGGNGSSILPRVTKKTHTQSGMCFFVDSTESLRNANAEKRCGVRNIGAPLPCRKPCRARQILPRFLSTLRSRSAIFCFTRFILILSKFYDIILQKRGIKYV